MGFQDVALLTSLANVAYFLKVMVDLEVIRFSHVLKVKLRQKCMLL